MINWKIHLIQCARIVKKPSPANSLREYFFVVGNFLYVPNIE